jgi:SP family sugar:H+ symporter-like MFS transporter
LGSRIGMVYGGVSIISIAFVFFVVPEMKKRSLEELDEMFHAKVPAWRSRSFVSTGVGAQISTLEGVDNDIVVGKSMDNPLKPADERPVSKS